MQTQRQTAGDKLRFKLANMGAKGMKKKAAARKGITKLRRKQALLDRAIALRQGAAAGRSRVMLPGGLIDFDVKGVLKK